ncbi:MAG: hypothetical protein KC731_30650, partial [Myxococcales bacterium]|nr:hypothetical protein [Myxococcales bacterium]
LLFVGTEFGAHVSVDRGAHWHELGAGLPTVAVHDLAIHDREQDLVAATHGTAFWVLDIAPLRELRSENFGAGGAHLFRPERATLWNMRSRELQGHRDWAAANPAYGAAIHLWLAEAPKGRTQVTIHDISGEEVASLPVASRAGFQVLNWDCRVGTGRRRSSATPGSYSVRYRHGENTLVQPLRVRPDPGTEGSHALSPAPYAGTYPATFPEASADAEGDQTPDRDQDGGTDR